MSDNFDLVVFRIKSLLYGHNFPMIHRVRSVKTHQKLVPSYLGYRRPTTNAVTNANKCNDLILY